MKIVAIIQARMGSTRLPGKVLLELCGKSVLAHVVERVGAAAGVDRVLVATTGLPADDGLAAAAGALGCSVFRGSETDVLSRYYHAAAGAAAELVVRVTADCPLFDPAVLAAMLARYARLRAEGQRVDYLSNTLERSYPRGLDAEIFPFAVLEQAHAEAARDFEREHVTPFIYGHPERFALHNFSATEDGSQYRWTLDTAEDWQLIEAVYAALYRPGARFGMAEVLGLLRKHPELAELNAHVEQKRLMGST